jgi:hypothetical protein
LTARRRHWQDRLVPTEGVRVDSEEQRRAGESEAMFRDVNEMIAFDESTPGSGRITFLCECADEFCVQELSLSRSEYEQVRAVAEHFAVAADHVAPGVETIVERHPHYWVVEKLGEAGEIAEETDPRSDP